MPSAAEAHLPPTKQVLPPTCACAASVPPAEERPDAVRVTAGNPLVPELDEFTVTVEQVADVHGIEVTAFDHDVLRPQCGDAFRGLASIVVAPDGDAAERFGFQNIGRHEKRAPQQFRLHRLRHIVDHERVAALGHHHRIDDEQRQLEIAHRRSHRFDDRGGCEHAGLHRMNADVRCHRFDLRSDEIGRQGFHHGDAECVLRGDGGDGARAVHAVRGECLEIGLNARARARIAARDRERGTHGEAAASEDVR